MALATLAALLVKETKAAIYEKGLAISRAIGLPVTSWQAGDPSRALFALEAEILSYWEEVVVGFVSSGFLDWATGFWLVILAEQVFSVEVPEATYAETTVTLTNAGGGVFEVIEPGDLTFKNSVTGKTYTNTTGTAEAGILGAGGSIDVTVVADEPGSDSSASAGEIELVTSLIGVTATNATAAVGTDRPSDEDIRALCRASVAAVSPNGPAGAYVYIARSPKKTGTTVISDARSYGDSDTGEMTLYLRSPSGAVEEADRALVEAAIVKWSTPLCITPIVLSCSTVVVPVTYELWVYKSVNKTDAEIQEAVEDALEQMFAARPIGGDIVAPATTGKLYTSLVQATIRSVFPEVFRVSVSAPAADVALTNGQVAVLGTVTGTVHLERDP